MRCGLKTPYRDGTTQVFSELGEFMAPREVPDETCLQCGGRLRVIASIEAPAVIERILEHLGRDDEFVAPAYPCRAPPARDRLI